MMARHMARFFIDRSRFFAREDQTQLSSRGVTECRDAGWWLLRWWRLARRHCAVQQSSASATYSPRFIWCAIELQSDRGQRFLSHLTSPFWNVKEATPLPFLRYRVFENSARKTAVNVSSYKSGQIFSKLYKNFYYNEKEDRKRERAWLSTKYYFHREQSDKLGKKIGMLKFPKNGSL